MKPKSRKRTTLRWLRPSDRALDVLVAILPLRLKIEMMRPVQYGTRSIAATGEVLSMSVLFLALDMTLSGISLSQAMVPSFPVEVRH